MAEHIVVAQTGEAYPALLRQINDPPPLLYVRGTLPSADERLIAVVGTRKPTDYGKEVTMFLTRELCRAGFSIVSGMALGVDALAHDTALEEGAKTYAVLGCGVDVVYPPSHKKLYERIAAQGAVLSEYDPGTPPMQFRFPERNRIIAGMCEGTLVVEAKEKSGALITGRLALEYNRDVFAVPGSIFAQTARGPHALIKDGAKLVEGVNDILCEFGMEVMGVHERMAENLSDDERKVFAALQKEAKGADVLVRETALATAAVHSAITMLEIKGIVERIGGNVYGIKR